MERYHNNVQDSGGNAIRSPLVAVYDRLASPYGLATIYSDDGVNTKANPFRGDVLGQFEFYAANGRYDIVITDPVNRTFEDVLLYDSADDTGGGGAGGDWEPLAEYTLTGDNETLAFFSGSDTAADFDEIEVTISGLYMSATADLAFQAREEGGSFLTTAGDYAVSNRVISSGGSLATSAGANLDSMDINSFNSDSEALATFARIYIDSPGSNRNKRVRLWSESTATTGNINEQGGGVIVTTNALDAIRLLAQGAETITAATVRIRGRRTGAF